MAPDEQRVALFPPKSGTKRRPAKAARAAVLVGGHGFARSKVLLPVLAAIHLADATGQIGRGAFPFFLLFVLAQHRGKNVSTGLGENAQPGNHFYIQTF